MTPSKQTLIRLIITVLLIAAAIGATLDVLTVTDHEADVSRHLADAERIQGNRGPKLTQPHSLQAEMRATATPNN